MSTSSVHTMAFAFDFSSIFQCGHQQVLASASIHHAHEAEALRDVVQRLHIHEAAVHGGCDMFIMIGGHRCSVTCRLEGPPKGQTYYECPRAYEHPAYMQNADGSVLHRWSGDVSVCWQTGDPHICTTNMCNHQVTYGGEIVCSLTARHLGAPTTSVRETGNLFDSGKAMTTCIETHVDISAIDSKLHSWRMNQAGAADQELATRKAAEQARALTLGSLKRTIDLHSVLTQPRIAAAPSPKRVVTERPPAAEIRILPILSSGPSESEIRESFRVHVDTLWNLLEESYSMAVRNAELAAAQQRALARCIDRRRTGQSGNARKVTFDMVASIHAEETAHALEGLEWVRIMASWPQWRSGHIRRVESQRLVDRMWKLWCVVYNSSEFSRNVQPHLFKQIGSALLVLVTDGHDTAVCVHRANGRTLIRKRCSHRDGSNPTSECGHDKQILNMVRPSQIMTRILAPPGIRRRAYEPACGHVFRTTHAVESYIVSSFNEWQTPAATRALCVGD